MGNAVAGGERREGELCVADGEGAVIVVEAGKHFVFPLGESFGEAVGEILLIAGDDSHKIKYGDVGAALAATRGLTGALPKGRPGNPDNDDAWFVTEWMDTTRAQEALQFQHHSWDNMLAEMRANAGWTRYILPFFAPLIRAILTRRGAYWKQPGQYADPWDAIRRKLGEPGPDKP